MPEVSDHFWLPSTATAPCCVGKSCGETYLELVATKDLLTGVQRWAYVRESNGDVYLSARTEQGLVRAVEKQIDYWARNGYDGAKFTSTDPARKFIHEG